MINHFLVWSHPCLSWSPTAGTQRWALKLWSTRSSMLSFQSWHRRCKKRNALNINFKQKLSNSPKQKIGLEEKLVKHRSPKKMGPPFSCFVFSFFRLRIPQRTPNAFVLFLKWQGNFGRFGNYWKPWRGRQSLQNACQVGGVFSAVWIFEGVKEAVVLRSQGCLFGGPQN